MEECDLTAKVGLLVKSIIRVWVSIIWATWEALATRTCGSEMGLRKEMQHTLIFDRKNPWFSL